jgi:hypothetical protein
MLAPLYQTAQRHIPDVKTLKKKLEWNVVDWLHLIQRKWLVGSRQRGNRTPGSIKSGYYDHVSKMNAVSCSYFITYAHT